MIFSYNVSFQNHCLIIQIFPVSLPKISRKSSAYEPTRTATAKGSWPWKDDNDVRRRQDALVDALRADPGSMLHPAFTPTDIGRLVKRHVKRPTWLWVAGSERCVRYDSAFEFDLGGAEQAWVWRAQMPDRCYIRAATLSAAGAPLVIGGVGVSSGVTNIVSEFMPRHDSWRPVTALPEGRGGAVAITVGTDVFVCGGATPRGSFSSDMQVLRAEATEWTFSIPMPLVLSRHACAALADVASPGFVVAGGLTRDYCNSARSHRYDCTSDRWTRLGDVSSPRCGMRAETLGGGAVYVCGGYGSAVTERLDVRAGAWQVIAPLPEKVGFHATCLFDEMTMVSLGGDLASGQSNCCFAYDVRADRWWEEPRWRLPYAASDHTVTRF